MHGHGRTEEGTGIPDLDIEQLPATLPAEDRRRTGGKRLCSRIGRSTDRQEIAVQIEDGTEGAAAGAGRGQKVRPQDPHLALAMVMNHRAGSTSTEVRIGSSQQDVVLRHCHRGTETIPRVRCP